LGVQEGQSCSIVDLWNIDTYLLMLPIYPWW